MDVDEAINNRFSCRSYNDKKVKENDLHKILENALKAPNSGNLQNTRLIVIKDLDKKREVMTTSLNQTWMMQAPVFIVVCSDLINAERIYHNKAEMYAIQDCAAATENLMLTATSMGLATCWIGSFDSDKMKTILRLKAKIEPYVVIILGYTNEDIKEKVRSDISSFVYFNEFGNRFDKDTSVLPLSKYEEKIEKKSKGFFNKLFKRN